MTERLQVRVLRLEAEIPEGIPVTWQGRQFSSGPLRAKLRDGASGGSLDYTGRTAELLFHVQLEFTEFAEMLRELGVESDYARPVHAVIRSNGPILEGHRFGLTGECEVLPHALLAPEAASESERASAAVLPGT